MTPKTDESQQGDFRAYPTNRMIGVLPTRAAAEAAVRDLVAGGVPAADVEVFCGEAGLREVDFKGEHHGLWARVFRAVQSIGELAEYKERFEQALRAGECVLAADAAELATRELAHRVLKANGARYINFFAPMAVERLEP